MSTHAGMKQIGIGMWPIHTGIEQCHHLIASYSLRAVFGATSTTPTVVSLFWSKDLANKEVDWLYI